MTKAKHKSAKRTVKKRTSDRKKSSSLFPIVGIGASAGGLEAFIDLFSKMPEKTGMAFVFVQHLEPNHPSMSASIISRSTKIKVSEVRDGTLIEPDHIYVIPPNHNMTVKNGYLKLLPSSKELGPRLTIDIFFNSLAAEEKTRVIGVVLSGTGSDGTHGLKAIKDEGGVTFAQYPASAKYSFMPQNAISAGVADLILAPADIAKELTLMAKNPYLRTKFAAEADEDDDAEPVSDNKSLQEIFNLLKTKVRVDFSDYKPATIARRIQRRMVVQKISALNKYSEYLKTHPEEVSALYNDILINVTEFFRDPAAHKSLLEDVFPLLIKKSVKVPIRIWVPGCATGEEVYSIAISLLEFMDEQGAKNPLQIFATDISEHCIQHARVGFYAESIARNVSPERLKRFFDHTHDGYKIHKNLRDLCLFSRHDVTLDPPFGKLDLISCRNLLIYLGPQLQKRVMPIFHYALNPSGILWLGKSETPGITGAKLFTTVNKDAKIYCKINKPTPMNFRFPPRSALREVTIPEKSRVFSAPLEKSPNFAQDADKIMLGRFAPPSVIVNAEMDILQFRGRISAYLEPSAGVPSNHLFKMAKPEILSALRSVIQTAKKENKPVRRQALHHGAFEKGKPITIEVLPTNPLADPKDRTYLILFDEPPSKPSAAVSKLAAKKTKSTLAGQQLSDLQRELAENKNHQASLSEQYDISQEELTSTIEELQSTNEELQSTNEEMETAKEELQSTNEELTTVNDEMQLRNSDLVTLGSDLNNLLVATEIPILMVGNDRRIRRFTPKAERAFNMIPSDVGRPVGQIKSPFNLDFEALVMEVSRDLIPKEIEVQDQDGIWKRVQIRPYKTIENKIDGAIISVVDIETLKQREILSKEARLEAERANRTKDVFLATLSHELRTPLSSILTWAQLIKTGKVDYEKAREGAAVIESSAKTQNQLIDDLLDISRITMGKLALDIKEINPNESIEAALTSVLPMAQKKNINIKFHCRAKTAAILGDPVRLQQIVWNLLTNAIKFSPKDSTIEVHCDAVGKNLQIKVIDFGKGIPPEFIADIFNRFSQADSSSTRVHGGLGLGLSIVSSLVGLQGGTVTAENNPDKGAMFTVNFPHTMPKATLLQTAPGKTTQGVDDSAAIKDFRILFVEDDESTREAMCIYLQSFGAKILAVTSVAEALDSFEKFKPQFLISDIAMAGQNGLDLIKKVRKMPKDKGGNIAAIALTAYATAEDQKVALEAGFDMHIAKPVEVNYLIHKILELLKEKF